MNFLTLSLRMPVLTFSDKVVLLKVRTWDAVGSVSPSLRTVILRHAMTPYGESSVAISTSVEFSRSLHTITPFVVFRVI